VLALRKTKEKDERKKPLTHYAKAQMNTCKCQAASWNTVKTLQIKGWYTDESKWLETFFSLLGQRWPPKKSRKPRTKTVRGNPNLIPNLQLCNSCDTLQFRDYVRSPTKKGHWVTHELNQPANCQNIVYPDQTIPLSISVPCIAILSFPSCVIIIFQ